VDEPLQWILQRKKGNPRSKNSGWMNRSYCTTRRALIRCVAEYLGKVEHVVLAKLNALPEHHLMQNLDVHGTDCAPLGRHSTTADSESFKGARK
jgi:hypothetical protein